MDKLSGENDKNVCVALKTLFVQVIVIFALSVLGLCLQIFFLEFWNRDNFILNLCILIIMFLSLYISNFLLYALVFRSIIKECCNKHMKSIARGLLFIRIIVICLSFVLLLVMAGGIALVIMEESVDVGFEILRIAPTRAVRIMYEMLHIGNTGTRFLGTVTLICISIIQLAMLISGIKKVKDGNGKKWLYVAYFYPFIGSTLYLCSSRNKNKFGGLHNE